VSPSAHFIVHVPQLFGSSCRLAQYACSEPHNVSPPVHASAVNGASLRPDESVGLESDAVVSDVASIPGCVESVGTTTSVPLLEPPSPGPAESVDPHPGPVNIAATAVAMPSPARRTHDPAGHFVIGYPAREVAVDTYGRIKNSHTESTSAT
jgi:hypothetical protein